MNVLVIHPTPRPFIDLDVDLLGSAFDVRAVHVRFAPRAQFVADTIAALRDVRRADVVLAWFGGLHALLPFLAARLLGKQCAVVASGVDVAAQPSIGYGHMRGGTLRWIGLLVFGLAHRVFAVSQHTAREVQCNARVPAEKVQVIYHGVPDPGPPPLSPEEARSGVITVAAAHRQTVRRKGLETFVRTAALLPDIPFRLMGGGSERALASLRRIAPPNVAFLGWQDHDVLLQAMRRAQIYVQISAYESFGMALAEAMRCGCLPVVTEHGALPEVVGSAGWYVPYGNPEAAAGAIREALAAPPSAAERARRRIGQRFSLEERRRRLVDAIRTLGHRNPGRA